MCWAWQRLDPPDLALTSSSFEPQDIRYSATNAFSICCSAARRLQNVLRSVAVNAESVSARSYRQTRNRQIFGPNPASAHRRGLSPDPGHSTTKKAPDLACMIGTVRSSTSRSNDHNNHHLVPPHWRHHLHQRLSGHRWPSTPFVHQSSSLPSYIASQSTCLIDQAREHPQMTRSFLPDVMTDSQALWYGELQASGSMG